MDGWRFLSSGAFLAATFSFLYLASEPGEHVGNASSRNLVIGVLSARDHFLQRDAVRRTWGSQVPGLPNSELVFMVGEYDCPIHPEDRVSPHGCEKWHLSSEDSDDTSLRSFFKVNPLEQKVVGNHFGCYTGIGFHILHPVILESFSVPFEFLSRIGNCTVFLQDAEEILETVEVTPQSCVQGSVENKFCDIKLTQPLLLPRQFEGELRIIQTGISESDICGQDFFSFQTKKEMVCDWSNNSVIKFKYLRSAGNALAKWNSKQCPFLSASYTITDRDELRKHIEEESSRRADWGEHLDFVLKKIAIEQVLNRDMIVLPHLDVYSRLPQKILTFIRRLTFEFDSEFFMKVDDDTIVNIEKLKMLINTEQDDSPKMWSRFHHHRSVPLYGKWADPNYQSLTYPTFPSGAGYLMSGSLAQSLSRAGLYLTPHIGEDVSVGIWMSSAVEGAELIDVPCWLPRFECQETILIPQLSPIDMIEIWKEYA